MEFKKWLQVGLNNQWIGPMVCYTHDGLPTSREEDDAWAGGEDICMWLYRSYENAEHAAQVEDNHSASQWRKLPNDK